MRKIVFFGIILTILFISYTGNAQPPVKDELFHYTEAENLRKRKQYANAIEQFEVAVEKSKGNTGNHYKYYYGIAQCSFRMKNEDVTLEALNNSIKSKQDFVPAYLMLARLYRVKKDWAKVNENLDEAFKHETDPEKKVGYKISVMQHLARSQNFEGAFAKVQEAKTVAADNLDVNYFYAKIGNQLNKFEESKKALKAVESKIASLDESAAAKYYYELGYSCFSLNDFVEANKYFEKAKLNKAFLKRVRKFQPQYFCGISQSYLKIYENETSQIYVQKAMQVQQSFPLAHILMSQLAKRGQDHNSEIQHLQNAVNNQPDFPRRVAIYDKISDLQLQMGDYDNCIKTINESLKIKKDDPEAWFQRCVALFKMSRYDECVVAVDDAIKNSSRKNDIADLQFLSGIALKKQQKYLQAKTAFYKALQSSHRDAAEIELVEVEANLKEKDKK